jgi:hypothetical protein
MTERLGRLARAIPLHLNLLELFLLLLCVFSGALNGTRLAVTGTTGADVPAGTPLWAVALWYTLLVVGGAGALIGAFWRDPLLAALITRASMWPIAAGGVAFAYIVGSRGSHISAGVILVFAGFAVGHGVQVTRRARAEAARLALLRRGTVQP